MHSPYVPGMQVALPLLRVDTSIPRWKRVAAHATEPKCMGNRPITKRNILCMQHVMLIGCSWWLSKHHHSVDTSSPDIYHDRHGHAGGQRPLLLLDKQRTPANADTCMCTCPL